MRQFAQEAHSDEEDLSIQKERHPKNDLTIIKNLLEKAYFTKNCNENLNDL